MPPTAPPPFFSTQIVSAHRFYLAARRGKSPSLAVVCGGRENCAADYAIARDHFPYWGLEYVHGGRGELQLAGRRYGLQAGSIFVYGRNIAHTIATDPKNRLSKSFVDFTGQGALPLLKECGLRPGAHFTISARDEVQKSFEELLRMGHRSRHAGRLTALQLQILLFTIAGAREVSSGGGERAFHTFSRCREYLEKNFLKVNHVEQAARACAIDAAYLSRLFQRFARRSAHGFLQQLKMGHAASLLEEGQSLVKEIADLLELDPFQFSRTFKRVHGIPPTVFMRERMKLRQRGILANAENGRRSRRTPAKSIL